MSCSSNSTPDTCCPGTNISCFPRDVRPLASDSMTGLFQELFGDGNGLTYDNTTNTWTFTPLEGFPKLPGEGVVTYLLRLVGSGQVMYFRGAWSDSATYCIGSVVNYNSTWYVAVAPNTNSTPTSSPNWEQLLYSLEGLQGPQGPSGDSTIVTA